MHRPFVAQHVIPDALAGLQIDIGQPEILAARRLQVVEDFRAVPVEEFVPGDLHVHHALVHELVARPVGADGPDAVDLVPRPFVAVQQQRRIGRRKLHVIEPVGRVDQHLARARGDVDGEDVHRHVGGQTLRHAVFLGGGEAHRLAVRADRVIAAVRARHLRPRLQRHVLIGVGADQQRVVGVDRGDEALGDGGDLRRLAGGDVDGEDVVGRLGRVVLVRRTRAGIDHGLRGAGLEGR